jgi:CDP-glucose 4,6-dehydratase
MDRTPGTTSPLPFASAFIGRRVFVTGHTGFKGSWLSLWLHQLGAAVTGFSLDPPTQPNNFDESRIRELLANEVRADIRDQTAVARALDASNPDVVLHLAAQTVVRASYVEPIETFSSNVMGTAAVLEAIRLRGKPCAVVVVTSDKCYANDESGRAFAEDDPLGGDDPYSASKGATELVAHAYRHSFFPPDEIDRHGVALATARAGNVIGGGDWTPDGLIADVMRDLRAGQMVAIRNPNSVRPWQHVLEPLAGYLTLASQLLGVRAAEFCSAWNFGPNEADFETVAQVVERLVQGWGRGAWKASGGADDPPEANLLRISSAKARRELGWHSRWTLTEACGRIVDWYRRYDADPSAAREACLADITAYGHAADEASPSRPAERSAVSSSGA